MRLIRSLFQIIVLDIVFQENLSSSHLLLRRAAVSCLRQLATREAGDVSSLALSLVDDGKANIGDTGLEGVLLGMLDTGG